MADTFKCIKCGKQSNKLNVAEDRDVVVRFTAGPAKIKVYCQHCGTLNEVPA